VKLAPPQPFAPPWWARRGHVQTLLGHLLGSGLPDLPWERFGLALPDGDVLRLRLLEGTRPVTVVLFHGLGGSADSGYIHRASHHFHRRGYTVLAPNHRGAGEGGGLAARPYHSGACTDLSASLALARGRFPGNRLVAVGYSISANMLLLLLGRGGLGLTRPDLAVAVNPPADLAACALRLGRGLNRLYDRRFVRDLCRQVRARWEAGLIPPLALPPRMSLRDFDAVYTAPQAGFRDREAYYATCSSGPRLGEITTPTVILSAEDDPFAPASDLRNQPLSPHVHLHLERHGGHMGYLAARPTPLGTHRWLDHAVAHFVGELLGESGMTPLNEGSKKFSL
jgi:uncharacterized protein